MIRSGLKVNNTMPVESRDDETIVVIEREIGEIVNRHDSRRDESKKVEKNHAKPAVAKKDNKKRKLSDVHKVEESETKRSNDRDLKVPGMFDAVDLESMVGPYILGEFIAEGGYGEVFVGYHCLTDEPVALKKVAKGRLLCDEDFHAFKMELGVLSKTKHRNIVDYRCLICTPNNYYVVMSLGSQDLLAYIHMFPELPYNAIREIMIGVLRGINHLHEQGYAHLDIKLENILITKNVKPSELTRDMIQLCDLGMCRRCTKPDGDPILFHHFCGTTGYYPPEMTVTPFPWYHGQKADMWSMGVTLARLCLQLPHDWKNIYVMSPDEVEFRRTIIRCVNEMNECYYSEGLVHDLISQMMQVDPDLRPSARDVLEHPWFSEE